MPSSKGRPKPSLHTLSREELSPEDMNAFTTEMLGGSDRACALLCGSLLDSILAKVLTIKMIDLSVTENNEVFIDRNSVLGTFSNKIVMAYAIGLITKDQRLVLDRIRSIRNVFAHAMKPITFVESLVSLECKKLPLSHLAKKTETDRISPERALYVATTINLITEFASAYHEQIQRKHLAKALIEARPKT
jgi:hypothetical protein